MTVQIWSGIGAFSNVAGRCESLCVSPDCATVVHHYDKCALVVRGQCKQ